MSFILNPGFLIANPSLVFFHTHRSAENKLPQKRKCFIVFLCQLLFSSSSHFCSRTIGLSLPPLFIYSSIYLSIYHIYIYLNIFDSWFNQNFTYVQLCVPICYSNTFTVYPYQAFLIILSGLLTTIHPHATIAVEQRVVAVPHPHGVCHIGCA